MRSSVGRWDGRTGTTWETRRNPLKQNIIRRSDRFRSPTAAPRAPRLNGMPQHISPEEFHASDAVGDWRLTGGGARARFRTGSFATGAQLVQHISRLAAAADHYPDVELRQKYLGVRLWTLDISGISELDVALAQQISAAARQLGVAADPSSVRSMQLTIDASSLPAVMPFWQAVLGYDACGDDDVIDPFHDGIGIHFQQMNEPRTDRNRIHLDLFVPQEVAQARVAAAIAAGGRIVSDAMAPMWWTLADPEGNEVDVAPRLDAH